MKEALARTKNNPKKRLNDVYDVCKTKKICEGGADLDTKKKDELGESIALALNKNNQTDSEQETSGDPPENEQAKDNFQATTMTGDADLTTSGQGRFDLLTK